jgi:hypothetical protein
MLYQEKSGNPGRDPDRSHPIHGKNVNKVIRQKPTIKFFFAPKEESFGGKNSWTKSVSILQNGDLFLGHQPN